MLKNKKYPTTDMEDMHIGDQIYTKTNTRSSDYMSDNSFLQLKSLYKVMDVVDKMILSGA